MTNIALIGGGHIHAPSFIKRINEDAEIQAVAVWDQDAGRAAERAEALSAPVVSLDEIWADASIPAVVICSETDQHEELVLASAAAGKDMFVEKPLGMAAADSYSMAAAIREAGVKFQTGYFNRANAAHMFIRGQLAAGAFGTVTRVRHSNCHSGALAGWFDSDWRWMADPAIAGCGAYGDLGTHSLDLLLWLFGEVEQVTGSIMSVTDRYPGCDETGEGFLKFKSGVIGSIAASWVDVGNPITLQVFGTEGWATVINGKLHLNSAHIEGADGEIWEDLPDAAPHPFQAFLDGVAGRPTGAFISADEAAYSVAVMTAIYEGARSNRWVAPDLAGEQ